jgi:hypothetical protein
MRAIGDGLFVVTIFAHAQSINKLINMWALSGLCFRPFFETRLTHSKSKIGPVSMGALIIHIQTRCIHLVAGFTQAFFIMGTFNMLTFGGLCFRLFFKARLTHSKSKIGPVSMGALIIHIKTCCIHLVAGFTHASFIIGTFNMLALGGLCFRPFFEARLAHSQSKIGPVSMGALIIHIQTCCIHLVACFTHASFIMGTSNMLAVGDLLLSV